MIVSFDCYGTLIDWENGILGALRPVLENHGIEIEDQKILSLYADVESEIERDYKPYSEVLVEVVDRFGKILGFTPNPEERRALLESIAHWRPFPEVREVLEEIKKKREIAVISNTDDHIIEKSIVNIGVEFDHVITAQMVGAYKPDLKVFEFAQKAMNASKDDWIHVAQSVYHDIIPAKRFGFKTVLVLRRGFGATPRAEGKADYTVEDLNGLLSISPLGL